MSPKETQPTWALTVLAETLDLSGTQGQGVAASLLETQGQEHAACT